MSIRKFVTLVTAVVVVGLSSEDSSAQPLGAFRWQLQPYCNVIEVTVVQQGAQYQLDGTDDQCGADRRAAVTGMAFLNPDGSIGLGLSIVTTPGGVPAHIDATITVAGFSGTWRDGTGGEGDFVFTPGAGTGGDPRPPAGIESTSTKVGGGALGAATTGTYNTAIGTTALGSMTAGDFNAAVGFGALFSNLTGDSNVAVGYNALANSLGNNNVGIGYSAGAILVTGSNNIYIGAGLGQAIEDNATYIGNIFGATSASGAAVFVNSAGKLGTATSSARFKQEVTTLGDVSRLVQSLRPVSFYYKPEFDDGSRVKQYGLIAEEVADVMPDLVIRDKDGAVQSVRYHFLPPLLLAEVQRLEQERAELTQQVARQAAALAKQATALAELRTLLEELRARR